MFESLLKIRNGSTFGSCWIGDFPQYPLGWVRLLWAGAEEQTPNTRKPPTIQSGHCKLCVDLTASLIFSANTIKEATLAQTEELVTIKEATLAQTEELVTINKQLAAISAKIDSFGDSFGTTSEKAKSLIDDRYDTQQTMNFVVTVLALGALLFFVVSAIRRYFRM